jgi:choline monooxygenase
MASNFYLDPAQYDLSLEQIFARSWQFIGTTQTVFGEAGQAGPAASGSMAPITLLEGSLNEPLLLTQDNEKLHCLSNVCTHRGSILIEKNCQHSSIRCRYHGAAPTDGTYQSAPGFEGAEDFPAASDSLPHAALGSWGNLLFAGIKPDIELDQLIGEMKERLAFLPLDEFKFAPELSRDYFVNANWALYVENYLEGLHVPFIHPSLVTLLDTKAYHTDLHPFCNVQIGVASKAEDAFDLPPSSPDHGQLIAAFYYWLFPNMMFNFLLGFVSQSSCPKAITQLRSLQPYWREERFGNYSTKDINQTEIEDEEVVELVQRGIRSRLYDTGRYSPTWEAGVFQFHNLIRDFMKQ